MNKQTHRYLYIRARVNDTVAWTRDNQQKTDRYLTLEGDSTIQTDKSDWNLGTDNIPAALT